MRSVRPLSSVKRVLRAMWQVHNSDAPVDRWNTVNMLGDRWETTGCVHSFVFYPIVELAGSRSLFCRNGDGRRTVVKVRAHITALASN